MERNTRYTDTARLKYADYYIFQMNDGNWWIAPATEHEWNGKPTLPRRYDRSYRTRAKAAAALELARRNFARDQFRMWYGLARRRGLQWCAGFVHGRHIVSPVGSGTVLECKPASSADGFWFLRQAARLRGINRARARDFLRSARSAMAPAVPA